MLLGITGTDGAGKGVVVDYLVQQKGFVHYSARAMLRAALERQGRAATRHNLRLMGNELRSAHGNDYLVRYYLTQYQADQPAHAIIESIRAVAEVETLKSNGGVLLAIDADQHLRYERIQARKSSSDQIPFTEFVEHEALEMNDPDPHGMQKAQVIAAADYTILNNGSLAELQAQIDAALTTLGYDS